MSEDDQSQRTTAFERVLTTVVEGGIPQIIAGPAGKALSRLIGNAADVPAAWLEQKAQAIRDKTLIRREVMKNLGKAVSRRASADKALVERATDHLMGEIYRKQTNREDIAQKTINHLQEDAAHSEAEGPDDDWLNVFESHAERASSDRLRETWARVLSGEIRKRGAFSLSTLQFVSILDERIAKPLKE